MVVDRAAYLNFGSNRTFMELKFMQGVTRSPRYGF